MTRAAGLLAAFLAACAASPPGPAEQATRAYDRDNARIEAVEHFHERKRQCAARGGTWQLPRSTSGRLPPTVGELQLARCAAGPADAYWL